ncbi:MAG: hypothetical protein C5B51_05930 [Terriglobia bacterium]|nr:MAG: hypothetical protein C5B51_05930 [Terriglobia bacterium]
MRSTLRVTAALCWCVFLGAQAPNPQANGLQPDWDVGVILQEMSAHGARLLPLLEQLDAKGWAEKGASETYAAQLQSSKDQVRTLTDEAKALARNPERLSAGLELYFRIQAVDQMIGSLLEGTRKYQDAALADRLASLAAENGANRGRFQVYLVNLAAQREQECAVMDREAQRCRGILATQPPPPRPTTGRKK